MSDGLGLGTVGQQASAACAHSRKYPTARGPSETTTMTRAYTTPRRPLATSPPLLIPCTTPEIISSLCQPSNPHTSKIPDALWPIRFHLLPRPSAAAPGQRAAVAQTGKMPSMTTTWRVITAISHRCRRNLYRLSHGCARTPSHSAIDRVLIACEVAQSYTNVTPCTPLCIARTSFVHDTSMPLLLHSRRLKEASRPSQRARDSETCHCVKRRSD